MADGYGVPSQEWRDLQPARDRGVRRLACLVVLAVALLACALPQVAGAHGAFQRAKGSRPSRACHPQGRLQVSCEALRIRTVPKGLPDGSGPQLQGGGEGGGLDPQDLRSAYKLPVTGGRGETVAIVDEYDDPTADSDLEVYRKRYNLPACTEESGCLTKVNQKGETANYPPANQGWDTEISLDLDMVSAACQECHILLVEANPPSVSELDEPTFDSEFIANMTTAELTAGKASGTAAISNSWANDEFAGETAYDKDFVFPGIAVTVGSGDHFYGAMRWPGTSEDVISVGGTKLTKEGGGREWTEEVWSESPEYGTTSGCSAYEPKPSWQTDAGCSRRAVSDVAADASVQSGVSVYDKSGGPGWEVLGGTSAAAPFIAGVEALSTSHVRALGAEAFYIAGKDGLLFDITKGKNGTCTPPALDEYLCTAEVGYDGPTGWGTPDGPFLGPAATTAAASKVTETEAALHGAVNPGGSEAKYWFEYGPTTSYGERTPEVGAGSGNSNVNVSRTVTGLRPGTHHFRVVVETWEGPSYGTDYTFTTPPAYTASFGSFGSGSGQMKEPTDLAEDGSGNVWVADWQNSRLDEFNSKGEPVRSVGSHGSGPGQFEGLYGVAVDNVGHHVWASDCGTNRIEEFSSTGTFEHAYGSQGSGNGQFDCPDGLALDVFGSDVYVADRGNHRVEEVTAASGAYVRSFTKPEEKEGPSDVAIETSTGDVWVTYGAEAKVAEFTSEGKLMSVWGTKGTAAGDIEDAYRLKIGPEGDIWLAEWGNNRVQVFTPSGEYVYGFGSKGSGAGQFLHARGIAFNGSKVYVLDSGEGWQGTGGYVEEWLLG